MSPHAATAPTATSPASSTPLTTFPPVVSHVTKHGYLFGQKLAASLSPYFHSVIYRHLGLDWEQFRLDSTDMDLFLRLIRDPAFYGAAVTMPHKVAILPHLDELEDDCRAVGACNTIFLRTDADGRRRYCGTNTDIIGIRDAFLLNVDAAQTDLYRRPGLVIGGGGAARSAVYALKHYLGVGTVYMVNRDADEVAAVVAECGARGFGDGLVHVATVAQAQALAAPGAIVACIPDYPPQTDAEVVARDIATTFLAQPQKGAMLEMCYNPSPYTALGALAEAAGWQVILGTEAMIYQGLEQDRYWTGQDVARRLAATAKEAIDTRLAERTA